MRLQEISTYFKHQVIRTRFNGRVQAVWFCENMDDKILLKIIKMFHNIRVLEFKPCKYKMSTMEVRKALMSLDKPIIKLSFAD